MHTTTLCEPRAAAVESRGLYPQYPAEVLHGRVVVVMCQEHVAVPDRPPARGLSAHPLPDLRLDRAAVGLAVALPVGHAQHPAGNLDGLAQLLLGDDEVDVRELLVALRRSGRVLEDGDVVVVGARGALPGDPVLA